MTSEGREQASVLSRLQALLSGLGSAPPAKRAEIRAEVLQLAELTSGLRRLSKLRFGALSPSASATNRILGYLKMFVGEVLDGKELAVVSGIQEYARRVRELRVQFQDS